MLESTKECQKHIAESEYSIACSVKFIDTRRSSAIISMLFLSLLLPCALAMHTDKDELKVKTPFKPKSTTDNDITFPVAAEDFK